MQNVASK